MAFDRLRAKEPPERDGKWKECRIKSLEEDAAIVINQGETVELNLTSELIDLFESRWDGGRVWYIKK